MQHGCTSCGLRFIGDLKIENSFRFIVIGTI